MKPNELLPPQLPGERVLDTHLIDHAVEMLNELYFHRALGVALEVGQVLIDHFFGGDMATFTGRSGDHISFRALADRDDLAFSHSYLAKAVRVRVQVTELGPELGRALSFTHHVALLPLRDPADRAALARKATKEDWTSKQLEVAAQRIHRKATVHRVGRPPLPAFMKQIRVVIHSTGKATAKFPVRADFENLDLDAARALMEEFDGSMEKLAELRARVEEHLIALG